MAKDETGVRPQRKPKGEIIRRITIDLIDGEDGKLYAYTTIDFRGGRQSLKGLLSGGLFGLPLAVQAGNWMKNLVESVQSTLHR